VQSILNAGTASTVKTHVNGKVFARRLIIKNYRWEKKDLAMYNDAW
jgi:hypothetical protein